jgi:hypothetical protein
MCRAAWSVQAAPWLVLIKLLTPLIMTLSYCNGKDQASSGPQDPGHEKIWMLDVTTGVQPDVLFFSLHLCP